MSLLKAVLLGLIQGVTEFLPISSSGHLSVVQHFLGVSGEGSLMFSVLLHLGTLAAVLFVYYKTVWALIKEFFFIIRDIFTGKFSLKTDDENRHMLFMFVLSCLPLLLLFIPVGGGRNLMDFAASLSEDSDIFVEGICFLLTAALLLFAAKRSANSVKSTKQIMPKGAFAVGFAQLFAAVFPGISRSGSTISTGILCSVRKEYMVRYSFILGMPAILAANAVELKDAVASGAAFDALPIVAGFFTAVVVGVAAIKILEWLVKTDKFKFFGYYCLAVGVVVLGLGAAEYFNIF